MGVLHRVLPFKFYLLGFSALCFTGISSSAHSAGFYLQEQSVSGLGMAFAGSAAKAHDASVIYFNPAGMTQLSGTNANLGLHLLVPKSDLDDTGSTFGGNPVGGADSDNPVDPTLIPNAYISHQITDNVWLGLGISVPFGLGGEYDENWFGRFDSIKSDLKTTNIQPSFAYKYNDWLSFGGGMDIQYVDIELTSAVNDGTQGMNKLEGEEITVGYNFGVIVEPQPGTKIGLSYRSAVNHEVNGRLSVTGTATSDTNINASAQLSTPDIISLGASHQLDEQWTLLGQVNYFGWNNFQSINSRNVLGGLISETTQDYSNTFAFSLGAEYILNDKWTLRGGYQFDETPTTDQFRTTRTPDGDRHWITAGATYQWDSNWSIDFAGAYIDVADETINLSRNSGAAAVNANSSGKVGIFALGVNYAF